LAANIAYEEAACGGVLVGCCAANPDKAVSVVGQSCTMSDGKSGICKMSQDCPALAFPGYFDYDENRCVGASIGCCWKDPNYNESASCISPSGTVGMCKIKTGCDIRKETWYSTDECGSAQGFYGLGCCVKE